MVIQVYSDDRQQLKVMDVPKCIYNIGNLERAQCHNIIYNTSAQCHARPKYELFGIEPIK